MAISTTGDPGIQKIVGDSQKRLAKARKKGQYLNKIVAIGEGTNRVLTAKATKRAQEFWNSDAAELNKMQDFVDTSIQFQDDFAKRFKGDPNWEQQYVNDFMNTYVDNKLTNTTGISNEAKKALFAQAKIDVQDDLSAFKNMLNLSSEFKLDGTMTAEKKQAQYFKAYQDPKSKRSRQIIANGSLIPTGLRLLGLRKEDAEGTPEEQAMQTFIDSTFAQQTKWNAATQDFDTAIGNNEIQDMFMVTENSVKLNEVIGQMNTEAALMKDPNKHKENDFMQMAIPYGDAEGNIKGTTSLFSVVKQLSAEDRDPTTGGQNNLSTRGKFIQDAQIIASSNWHKYKEAYKSGDPLYLKTDFMKDAVVTLTRSGNLQGVTPKVPSWYSRGSATYTKLDPEQMGRHIAAPLDSKYTGNFTADQAKRYNAVLNGDTITQLSENYANTTSNADAFNSEINFRIRSVRDGTVTLTKEMIDAELSRYSSAQSINADEYKELLKEKMKDAPNALALEMQTSFEQTEEQKLNVLSMEFFGVPDYLDLTQTQLKTIKNPTKRISELKEKIEDLYKVKDISFPNIGRSVTLLDLYDSTLEPDIMFNKKVEPILNKAGEKMGGHIYDDLGDQSGIDTSFGRFFQDDAELTTREINTLNETANNTPYKVANEWWNSQKPPVSLNRPNDIASWLFKNPSFLDDFDKAGNDPVKFMYAITGKEMPQATIDIVSGKAREMRHNIIDEKTGRHQDAAGGYVSLLSRPE